MNMFRGAASFLLIVAVIVLVECAKQAETTETHQAITTSKSVLTTKGPGDPTSTIRCPDMTANDTFCTVHSNGDCIVPLTVTTDSTDNTVSAPPKTWISDQTRRLVWHATENDVDVKPEKVTRVHFALLDNDKVHWKKGNKLLK